MIRCLFANGERDMKQKLLELIDKADSIRQLAHRDDSYMHLDFVLCDVPEFITWKQAVKYELIEMPNPNQFIEDTIEMLDRNFKGYSDKKDFDELCAALRAIKENVDEFYKKEGMQVQDYQNNKIFVVHGHDENVRDQVELFLRRIGLEPIILCNQPNSGLTIIEKIEVNSDVGFALVLYTACDEGKLKTNKSLRPRARQNVVFEHGYLIQKLSRKNVAALVEDGVETPGDLSGVLYISLNDADWKQQVMRELKSSGFEFDSTKA